MRIDCHLLFVACMATLGLGGCLSAAPLDVKGVQVPVHKESVRLEGAVWRLVSLGGKPAVVNANMPREAHLIFHSDQHLVSGSSGCNGMGGPYRLEGEWLTLGRMAATQMACEPTLMEQERRLFSALETQMRYRIEGRLLRLLNAGGQVVAEFEVRP